jgi:hypothetical protein
MIEGHIAAAKQQLSSLASGFDYVADAADGAQKLLEMRRLRHTVLSLEGQRAQNQSRRLHPPYAPTTTSARAAPQRTAAIGMLSMMRGGSARIAPQEQPLLSSMRRPVSAHRLARGGGGGGYYPEVDRRALSPTQAFSSPRRSSRAGPQQHEAVRHERRPAETPRGAASRRGGLASPSPRSRSPRTAAQEFGRRGRHRATTDGGHRRASARASLAQRRGRQRARHTAVERHRHMTARGEGIYSSDESDVSYDDDDDDDDDDDSDEDDLDGSEDSQFSDTSLSVAWNERGAKPSGSELWQDIQQFLHKADAHF